MCWCHPGQELEEFWPFKALLSELTRRLTYCVKAELIPLMEVTGVMEVRVQPISLAAPVLIKKQHYLLHSRNTSWFFYITDFSRGTINHCGFS